jgi:protein-S-isoprenylcysteine O-methyltransferase Ste14
LQTAPVFPLFPPIQPFPCAEHGAIPWVRMVAAEGGISLDLYSRKQTTNIPQYILTVVQLCCIAVTMALFFPYISAPGNAGISVRLIRPTLLILMNLLTFARFNVTLFVFIKRQIPTEEMIAVSITFAVYYVGFFMFEKYGPHLAGLSVAGGFILFAVGSLVNSLSELQRMKWKRISANHGKLFTTKLFALSRHPNYFGDVLWVLGYALVTGNPWALIIAMFLFFFFIGYNIPLQEKHMKEKYGNAYEDYQTQVKRLITYIL